MIILFLFNGQMKKVLNIVVLITRLFCSCFGLIKSIFMTDSNVPFLVCKMFKTLYFDKHYQAYNATITSNFVCIKLNDLENMNPTHHIIISNGLTIITLKL